MASIHKDPKSPYWQVYYTLPDGRRAHRSSRQRDRRKALDIARALERASEKARAGELTETVVRKLLDDVLESVGSAPLRKETVRSFFTAWLVQKQGSIKPAVNRLYRAATNRFMEFLGPRADQTLAGVTPRDIAAWGTKRLGAEGVSSGTFLLDAKILRSVFAQAKREGLLLHSPAEAVQLPVNRPLAREVFTPEEIRALLANASPEWQTLICLGYYLGARLSDAKALRWNCVDLAAGEIRYVQAKTGRAVIVPIHPDLHAHLLAIAGHDNPLAYLCPTLARRRNDGRGLSVQFARLVKAAGIDSLCVQTARRSFARKSFHSLRHSFSSHLANAGVSAELRMKLVGHTSAQTHTRYTHLEWAPLQEAIALLPGVRSPAEPPHP
jgi:integrase